MVTPVIVTLRERRGSGKSHSLDSAASTLDQWVNHCLRACARPATLYSGCRKILRPVRLEFSRLDDSIQLHDAGYSINKLRMLTKHYLHEESRDVAVSLWEKRRGQEKYGSVGFTTYAHFVKGGAVDAKRSKRASVFGPCIQSVMITLLNKKTYIIDVPYRTTELLKKFPADLVLLRDVLLPPFDFSGLECRGIHFHFANVTVHPMYAVTILPHLTDPIRALESIKKEDRFFYDWLIKWSARYVCPEHHRGIAKFSQALRVKKDAAERIDKDMMKTLQRYFRKNHPGHRNVYQEEEEDDEV